jgi:hypothetical protein
MKRRAVLEMAFLLSAGAEAERRAAPPMREEVRAMERRVVGRTNDMMTDGIGVNVWMLEED